MITKETVSLRTKHRVLRTIWALLTFILLGALIYFMYDLFELTMTLLTAFLVGVVLFIAYELVLLYELHQEKKKDNVLIRNSMFQIYFGKITLISCAFSFLVGFLFEVEITMILFLFASITLIILFSSFPYVRDMIETKTPLKS